MTGRMSGNPRRQALRPIAAISLEHAAQIDGRLRATRAEGSKPRRGIGAKSTGRINNGSESRIERQAPESQRARSLRTTTEIRHLVGSLHGCGWEATPRKSRSEGLGFASVPKAK